MAISLKFAEPERTADDIVARFRSGWQTASGQPVGLSSFRVTTGDPHVAERIAEVLGCDDDPPVTEWDTKTEEKYQVFTTSSKVPIIISPGDVRSSLVLWSRNNKKILETNGTYLIEDGVVTDKVWDGAHKSISEIRQDAKNGVGPDLSLQLYFSLADDPDLGKFKYFSGAWTASDSFNYAEDAVSEIGGPCSAVLELDQVEFTAKDGTEVSYTRPQLTAVTPLER